MSSKLLREAQVALGLVWSKLSPIGFYILARVTCEPSPSIFSLAVETRLDYETIRTDVDHLERKKLVIRNHKPRGEIGITEEGLKVLVAAYAMTTNRNTPFPTDPHFLSRKMMRKKLTGIIQLNYNSRADDCCSDAT